MDVPGLTGGVSLLLYPDERTYRYTLQDGSGNEPPNAEDNNHIILHDSVANEWRGVGSTLEYQGSDLFFGPASGDWGTIQQCILEVEIEGSFQPFGVVSVGGTTGTSVSSGQTLVRRNPFRVDYSLDSSSLVVPGGLSALWEAFDNYLLEGEVVQWHFTLVKANGDAHDTVSVSPSAVNWSVISNGLEYQGNDVTFDAPVSDITADRIHVRFDTRSAGSGQLGVVDLASPTVPAGAEPTLSFGNLTLTV